MRDQNATGDEPSGKSNVAGTNDAESPGAGSPDAESRDAGLPDATGTESITDRRLPPEIGENLRVLFGTDDRPETFGEWTDAVAAAFGDDWPPDVDLLCHDDEGRHRAETDEETYRFVCVLDAVMLPFLTETSTVEVRSEDPETGAVVTSHVSRSGIEIDPEEAVLSFGVAETDETADVTPESTYGALCPYVHAFSDEDAYERWAEGIDAPTFGVPLSDGFELVQALLLV